jgi:hypothetical protein
VSVSILLQIKVFYPSADLEAVGFLAASALRWDKRLVYCHLFSKVLRLVHFVDQVRTDQIHLS